MRIKVVSVFPELFGPFLETSLIGRARAKGLLSVDVHDLRDFTDDKHRVVDDEPYGGGGGMVMKAEPWIAAMQCLADRDDRRILLSPQGAPLTDAKAAELAHLPTSLVLLCGRYEGVDERVREAVVDEEVSIGDFVLSGGEVAAMVVIEAVSRHVRGVVGLEDSVENDSFRGGLLDFPHYTRPRQVSGLDVPAVLLSGDHAAIERWRRRQALQATLQKRPDLLATAELSDEDLAELADLRSLLGLPDAEEP